MADGAEAFADAVAKLYQDEALWNRISENGLVFAEQAWGVEAAWKTLAEILSDLGVEAKQAAYPLSLYPPAPNPLHSATYCSPSARLKAGKSICSF